MTRNSPSSDTLLAAVFPSHSPSLRVVKIVSSPPAACHPLGRTLFFKVSTGRLSSFSDVQYLQRICNEFQSNRIGKKCLI